MKKFILSVVGLSASLALADVKQDALCERQSAFAAQAVAQVNGLRGNSVDIAGPINAQGETSITVDNSMSFLVTCDLASGKVTGLKLK